MADTLAIIPTHLRHREDLILSEHAVRSLRATSDADLLVVDDGSPEIELARALEGICEQVGAEFTSHEQNKGFAASINIGLRKARKTGRHALLANADLQFWDNN